MPKQNIDYTKTLIYMIVCLNLERPERYIGQCRNLIKRKCEHKACCNNPNKKSYNFPVYQFIRENGGWDNWEMVLIEYYPCNNREEASKRERYWKEFYNAELNGNVPGRTRKEYYIDNADTILEKQKQYYQNNSDTRKEYQKIYDKQNIDKKREYNKQYYLKKKAEKGEQLNII
jgi:hypothetical protein